MQTDQITWTAHATVEKWTGDQAREVVARTGIANPTGDQMAQHFTPEVAEFPSNILTTAGLTRLMSLLTATGGTQAITATSARLGAGNGSVATAVGDTDLSATAGSANRWFQIMDASYPQIAAGVLTAKVTFGASDGNFVWNEWCLDVGAPTVTSSAVVNACMFNRRVVSMGTKANPAIWSLTITITIA